MNKQRQSLLISGQLIILFLLITILSISCNKDTNELYSTPEYPYISYYSVSSDDGQLLFEAAIGDYNQESFEADEWQTLLFARQDDNGESYMLESSVLDVEGFFQLVSGSMLYYQQQHSNNYVAWDLERGERHIEPTNADYFWVSNSGRYLADYSKDANTISILRLPEFEPWQDFSLGFPAGQIRDIAWANDDSRMILYVQEIDAVLYEINLQDSTVTRLNSGFISNIAFDNEFDWHSAKDLIVIGNLGVVSVFDLSRNCQLVEIDFGSAASQPTWSTDGNAIWIVRKNSLLEGHNYQLVLYDLSQKIADGSSSCK